MKQSPLDENALDLESSCVIGSEHQTVCRSESDHVVDELHIRIDEPHGSQRCSSGKREILENQFPAA